MTSRVSEGVTGMLEWCAERAAYDGFTRTVLPLLRSITEPYVTKRLGLTPTASGEGAAPVPMSCQEPWFIEECELLRLNRSFKTCLASNIIWLDAMYYVNLPGRVAVVNHPNADVVKAGFFWLKQLANAIVKAEQLVTSDPIKYGDLKKILETAYYLDEQLPREILVDP